MVAAAFGSVAMLITVLASLLLLQHVLQSAHNHAPLVLR